MTQFLLFLKLVLQPYLAFLSYLIFFQELLFFFCLSWLDTVSVECNQSSMTNTAPQDICQGRQIAGFQWTHDRLPVLSPNVFIPPASNHPTLEIGWGMTLL